MSFMRRYAALGARGLGASASVFGLKLQGLRVFSR